MSNYSFLRPYHQLRLKHCDNIVAFASWCTPDESFLYTVLKDPTKVPNLNTNLYLGHTNWITEVVSIDTSPYLTTTEDLIEILKHYPKNTVVMTNENSGNWSEVHPINPAEIVYSSSGSLCKIGDKWEEYYDDSDNSDDEEERESSTSRPILNLFA